MSLKILSITFVSLAVLMLAGCTEILQKMKPKSLLYIDDNLPIDQQKVKEDFKVIFEDALAHPIIKDPNSKGKPSSIEVIRLKPSHVVSTPSVSETQHSSEYKKLEANIEKYKKEHPQSPISNK